MLPQQSTSSQEGGPPLPQPEACTVPRLCPYLGWVLRVPPLWRHRDTSFTLSPLTLKCRDLVEPTLSDSPEFKGSLEQTFNTVISTDQALGTTAPSPCPLIPGLRCHILPGSGHTRREVTALGGALGWTALVLLMTSAQAGLSPPQCKGI